VTIPTSFSQLSTTPASNSPAGTDAASSLDDNIRTAFAFLGSIYANSATNGWVTPYLTSTSTVTVTAPRFEANNTDDTGTPDAAFRINRTLSTTTSAGHGFRDQTNFSRASGSYAAFDAAPTSAGNGTNDHIAAVQSRPDANRTGGTLSHVYNFSSSPTFTAGTVTNNYGLYVYNPTGAGTLTNNYGFYVASQTKGATLNYSGYIAQQDAPFFCGAPLQVNNLVTVDTLAPMYLGASSTTGYPLISYNYNPVTDDKAITDVAGAMKFDSAGMRFYVKPTGAALGTSGMLASMTQPLFLSTAGDVVTYVNTSAPSLSINQQMVFALTSNTNLRISVRGTDGTTRTANITLA